MLVEQQNNTSVSVCFLLQNGDTMIIWLFSILYGIILPIDELIFFKMIIAPMITRAILDG